MKAYERLIGYTSFATASNEDNPGCPSTPAQTLFGKVLAEEMRGLGITDARIDDNGYVYGTIPASPGAEGGFVLGFIAHMDVTADAPSEHIQCRLVKNYDGGDIVLNREKGIMMSPSEFETLKRYPGCDLVVTDGTTLLGADDKAGIAEIMTAAEILLKGGIPHGEIRIAFTPDEEICRGADKFDVAGFGADGAFTLDGGAFGEVEYETFNAAAARIIITGKNIHPGTAKNKMKNALRIATAFDTMLPEAEKPEYTSGYEGFYHLTDINGDVESAEMRYILRDHDSSKLEVKKDVILKTAAYLNDRYGAGTVEAVITDTYRNMAEKILPHRHLIDSAYEAVRQAGGEPVSLPVRGGTDGSKLSFMGLPCPNLGTGSHNHHSRFEYAVVQEMNRCVEMILNLAKIYAYRGKNG